MIIKYKSCSTFFFLFPFSFPFPFPFLLLLHRNPHNISPAKVLLFLFIFTSKSSKKNSLIKTSFLSLYSKNNTQNASQRNTQSSSKCCSFQWYLRNIHMFGLLCTMGAKGKRCSLSAGRNGGRWIQVEEGHEMHVNIVQRKTRRAIDQQPTASITQYFTSNYLDK